VLTALVVDDSTGARRRVGTMLHLGGWRVHQAVGTEAALRVYINQFPTPGFTSSSTVPIPGGAEKLAIGEIDGDGRPDVLLAVEQRVRLFTALDGVLVNVGSFLDDVPGTPIVLCGELTGDGMEDVILFSEDGQQQLLRRTGPASFDQEPLRAGGPATDLADVNGDGLLDGVCCGGGSSYELYNKNPSAFQISINDGGVFRPAFRIQGLGSHHLAGATDLDEDGDLDLVAGRTILWNDGGLHQPPPTDATTGSAALPQASSKIVVPLHNKQWVRG